MNDVKYKGKNLNDLSRVELIEALEQAAKMIQYLHERIIETHKFYHDFTISYKE